MREPCYRLRAFHLILARTLSLGLRTTDTNQIYWSYEDLGIYIVGVALFGSVVRLLVRAHFLPQSILTQPAPYFLGSVLFCLALSLYLLLRLRYHRNVLRPLGWLCPAPVYFGKAVFAGISIASVVSVFARHIPQYPLGASVANSPASMVLIWVIVGPVLEETLFRGFFLPVLARSLGAVAAIGITAVLFSLLHAPSLPAQWLWFTTTGLAYGWMRIASGSTLAAVAMHASYNLTVALAHFVH
jgi:membrane protease YdiL (CAAX protease family)